MCKYYGISTQNIQQHLEEHCGEVGNALLKLCTTMVQKVCPVTLAAQPMFSYVTDRFASTENQGSNLLIWNFIHQKAKILSMACELRSDNEPKSLENHMVVKDFLLP